MARTVSQWLFLLTVVLYLASAAAYFVYFYFRQGERLTGWLAWGAWLSHTGTLSATVAEVRHPPLYTAFESILFLTWVITLNYLLIEFLFRLKVVGVFLLPVVFAFLAYAAALPRPVEPSTQPMGSQWVLLHALIALGGYGAFALAFVAAVMYLLQERQLRGKAFHTFYHRLPSLETLDGLAYRLVVYGFPLLTLAIVTGSIRARAAWQTPWFWEPKGVWSLVTWGIYAAYIILRSRGAWGGRKAAYLVVAGFAAVLVNLFVVNLVLTRYHMF